MSVRENSGNGDLPNAYLSYLLVTKLTKQRVVTPRGAAPLTGDGTDGRAKESGCQSAAPSELNLSRAFLGDRLPGRGEDETQNDNVPLL